MENNKEHPKVLIEEWFPFEEVGIECQRERGVPSALPPVNYLHVWWARRPLTACKAAILASILPNTYDRKKFFNLMKFEKDLAKIHNNMMKIKRQGQRSKIGYSGKRVFGLNLSLKEKQSLMNSSIFNELKILDPMAGGGSIPFEAVRLGLKTFASDLNPIACLINISGYFYPNKFKEKLIPLIENASIKIIEKINSKLHPFFFNKKSQENQQYIWVRTVKCPDPKCGLIVPLSPTWDLARKPKVILQLKPPKDFSLNLCNFKVIEKPTNEQVEENSGTVKRGKGTCPRCNTPLSNEYIKNEFKAGRIGHQLCAIIYMAFSQSKKKQRKFRTPFKEDLEAIEKVDKIIKSKIKEWKEKNIFPDNKIEPGFSTNGLIAKGIDHWYQLFNNRQLLTNMTILESIIELKKELLDENLIPSEEIKAVITYLQFAFNKIINYNSILTVWMALRQVIVNTFNRHDFALSWTYAEMDVIRKGFDWAISNVLKSYKGLISLLGNSEVDATIKIGSSQKLFYLENKFIHVIVVDPPYYDNVMYAELSDYFYVWMTKGIGDLYPEFFSTESTNKDDEAVANTSKFEGMGKSKKQLAKQDYEAKMLQSFLEMYRVLKDDGVLVIMFTHKSTEAWDVLTMSLMEAGFEITASWPVNTESPVSLNIAKKNSVKTTIFLVCRKRIISYEELWWEDDVLPSIKKVVANKANKFRRLGIDGIDLFISCFGPALKEFSKSYPVRSISGDHIRAEEAIEVARRVVIDITLQDIIKGKSYNIDKVSKFYLTAWHFFKARVFPFDEARRLALSIGINIDDLKTSHKLLNKKSGNVELILPRDREKIGTISVDNPKDSGILINAVHIALLAYEQGGQKLFNNVIEKLRRNTDKSFRLYMETLFNILPDVKDLANNLPEKKILGEILMTTKEKITPEGGKITDFLDQ